MDPKIDTVYSFEARGISRGIKVVVVGEILAPDGYPMIAFEFAKETAERQIPWLVLKGDSVKREVFPTLKKLRGKTKLYRAGKYKLTN
jgi:hypothetical protein